MSMFDEIDLLTPIACPACGKDNTYKIEQDIEKEAKQLAKSKVKPAVLWLHKGYGGLSNFQTKDLNRQMDHYVFPGIIPQTVSQLHWTLGKEKLLSEEKESQIQESIELCEICPGCRKFFEGQAYTEKLEGYEEHLLLEYIELTSQDITIACCKGNEIYEVIWLREGAIRIDYNLKPAIDFMIKERKRWHGENQLWMPAIDEICKGLGDDGERILSEVREITEPAEPSRAYTKVNIAELSGARPNARRVHTSYQSALLASAYVAEVRHGKPPLEILGRCKVIADYNYEKEYMEWFAKKESKSHKRFFGIIGGPNSYLDKLVKDD